MTASADATSRASLGAGRIIGDTFSIFFKKIPAILLLGFVPALIELVLNNALFGQVDSENELDFNGLFQFLTRTLTYAVTWSIVVAAIVQLSYDAKLNRPARMAAYVATTIRNSPAVVALSIVYSVLVTLGFMLLIVPGLWLHATFSVLLPTIVIEGAGFRALGRSAELTRNYRWPIVGLMLVTVLSSTLLSLAGEAAAPLAATMIPGGAFYFAIIVESAANALGFGLEGVAVALVFVRLKEIKEGVAGSDLVDIFR